VQELERELDQLKEKNKELLKQLSTTSLRQNNDRNNNDDGGLDVHQFTELQSKLLQQDNLITQSNAKVQFKRNFPIQKRC